VAEKRGGTGASEFLMFQRGMGGKKRGKKEGGRKSNSNPPKVGRGKPNLVGGESKGAMICRKQKGRGKKKEIKRLGGMVP